MATVSLSVPVVEELTIFLVAYSQCESNAEDSTLMRWFSTKIVHRHICECHSAFRLIPPKKWNTMAQQERPQFVTVAEVAELMRVSKMTVYRMIHAGDLPAIRVGKSFRVPQLAVTQMIDAGLSDWEQEDTGTAGR